MTKNEPAKPDFPGHTRLVFELHLELGKAHLRLTTGRCLKPLRKTAKINNVDAQAWLTWVLAQIADQKITPMNELVPWWYAAIAASQGAPEPRQSAFAGRLLLICGAGTCIRNDRCGPVPDVVDLVADWMLEHAENARCKSRT